MTKSKLEELIKEAKNFKEHIDKGILEIGKLSERINEYNSFSIVNIKPKQYFKFECVLSDIRSGTYYGAIIDWNSGTFSTGSEEFDKYIRENTRIDEFLEKFAKSKDKDYNYFQALYVGEGYEKELSKEGVDIGYFKLGVPGSRPQVMVLAIYNPKREEWEKKLSLTSDVYQEKLNEYNKTQKLIDEFNSLKKHLNSYSKADSELFALKQKFGLDDESLKKMFNVNNLHVDYESIEKLVDEKLNEEKYAKEKQHKLDREEVDEKIRKILLPFEKGIPKERIQLGGSKKPTKVPDLIETGVDGTFSFNYAEGTSIPAGSVNEIALFDSNGNSVSKYSSPEKVDFSKGLIIHKEIARGGENYAHWLFYVDKNGKISQVAEFSDYYSEIIPIVGNPQPSRQIWYGFYSSDIQNRRHNDFKYIDDWVIIPFRKTHWGGHPNPKVPMEHGLVYHNTMTKDSLIVEKIPKIMLPQFIVDGDKLNLKADVLRLNREQIDESNGWIDIVKTEGTKAYIDIYEIIDFNHLDIAGLSIYKNANPTNPLDNLIKREYDNNIPRKAGPQIRHTIKLLDLKKSSYDTLSVFTDIGTCGYEHYSMPAEKGIIVVSRETGKKEYIY